MTPAGEIVRVPYENGAWMDAYFVTPKGSKDQVPAVIAFGGLDEFKDELLHEMPKHALPRGLSLLLVDLPGQGGTLRRQGLVNRFDTEVPIGRCVDYLISRGDVDRERIAVYGASLGGYYAPRAACFDDRISAVVSDGAIWNHERLARRLFVSDPESHLGLLEKWVFGVETVEAVAEKSKQFRLDGVLERLKCPYLITHGGADWLGLDVAQESLRYGMRHGVDVTLKIFYPEETGASHCQIDNPTLGQEFICDWLADRLTRR
jgi:cephalosporin-C deacetylase-like acetyl esterase